MKKVKSAIKTPVKIGILQWDDLFERIPDEVRSLYRYPCRTGDSLEHGLFPLSAFLREGDTRLGVLRYDNSLAALRLWNFLLSEEERLWEARRAGKKIFGVMKDLGTASIIAYAVKNGVGFYPDGAWWTPCIMELSAGLLDIADSMGVREDCCPVRATLGAFVDGKRFPIPDLCIAAVGACCDDYSAIMQRIEALENRFIWWELPYNKYRNKSKQDRSYRKLVNFVADELRAVADAVSDAAGEWITDEKMRETIRKANRVRRLIGRIRDLAYGVSPAPIPALETLICEMVVIHFCSDIDEADSVLSDILVEAERRAELRQGIAREDAVKVFWVNPVADLKVMNMIEEVGARVAGSEYLISHAFNIIDENKPPFEALAEAALSDPMIGPTEDRADMIIKEIDKYGAESVIISQIPGASHCAYETSLISSIIKDKLGLPVLEITTPSLSDGREAGFKTRFQALCEMVSERKEQ